MIIPSYKEDVRTNRTTMLSAALQDYPDLRVVLLIDDPYVPKTAEAARAACGRAGAAAARSGGCWPAPPALHQRPQVFEASANATSRSGPAR